MEAATAGQAPEKGKSSIKLILYGVLAALVVAFIGLFALLGSEGMNTDYQPQNEFKLDPWISLKIGPIDM